MNECIPDAESRHSFENAGRVCPADYRIEASAFAGEPEVRSDTLFVVGGLYGNRFALDALEQLVTNAANLGSEYGLVGGVAYATIPPNKGATTRQQIRFCRGPGMRPKGKGVHDV
ncbi:MAG: hypothetical protein LBL23_00035 [Coriobacteriales bacterium]|jgi:hypothetical protein|nr:hypothetical protein [Coriobacteriales bacterium]